MERNEVIGVMRNKNSALLLNNQAWEDVAEYEEDFTNYIREKDNTILPFTHGSTQLHYRQCLVKLLKYLRVKWKFSHSCLSLAVYLLDSFMDKHYISLDRLKLVAMCCFVLAAKMEENKVKVPKFPELVEYCNGVYSIEDFKTMEIEIWTYFRGSLNFQTAAHNIYFYIHKIICVNDLGDSNKNFRTLFYDLHERIEIYLSRIIEDIHYMQRIKPSKLAAATIAASRIDNQLTGWTKPLEDMTKYKIEELETVIMFLQGGDPLRCHGCQSAST